jgi:hypothetical protein
MFGFKSIWGFLLVALPVGFLILIIALIVSFFSKDESKPSFGTDIDAKAVARFFVEKELKDPDSAQYQDTHVYEMMLQGDRVKMYTICGKINAKNGFGGYTGFHDFVATVGFDKDGKEVPFVRNVFLEPSPEFIAESCHKGV